MSDPGYRSSRIRPAQDAVILPAIVRSGTPRERLVCGLRDVAVLPLVAAKPAPRVDALGLQLRVSRGLRRWAWRTERGIELAIAKRALQQHRPDDVIEIGNVLPLAGHDDHLVVDKYEQGPNVVNEDIVEFTPDRKYPLVISVSTLEHVGWDEVPVDPGKASRALTNMASIVAEGGGMLVTIPVAFHPEFEDFFVSDESPFDAIDLLVKTSRTAEWEQRPVEERHAIRYGQPYCCGNGVLVGIVGSPFAGSMELSPARIS